MKKMLTINSIREIQIKSKTRYYLDPPKSVSSKKQQIKKTGRMLRERDLTHSWSELVQPLWRTVFRLLKTENRHNT
jgi:hypothetical protein